jgi:ribosomal protein S18 acetylase RimI-like enzyme
LYDGPPVRAAAAAFLADPRHHLLVALDDDGRTVGFISGVEMTHPDKGTEMFLYELAVAEDSRQRGIGLTLTAGLADLARSRGCYGMWVGVDTDNAAAHATYRAAGGNTPERCDIITWTF